MDSVDVQILMHLQEDARASFAEIARRMGRAESTVRDRVRSLERNGIVLGYTALVDLERLGLAARARVEARCDMSRLGSVVRRVSENVHVRRIDLTTGARPVALQVLARNMADVDDVIREELEPAGLEDLEVEVHIQTLLPERAVPIARLVGSEPEAEEDVWAPLRRQSPRLEDDTHLGTPGRWERRSF